ncbi:MAG: DNA photolyase [Desulfobacterales bacterium]|nr:DNA photolyase [Desulfobacteraceae bacterium]MDY0312237.1 DNA photolyase [Desulfobacterales bacterium]
MIDRLYVEETMADRPEAATIAGRLGLKAEVVADIRQVFAEINADADPVERGKRTLLLTANRGAWLRQCPGTRYYTCCNYQILHVGTFCTMDCAYCILQAYFHPPVLQYFLNREEMVLELDRRLAQPEIARIGTGEFTDSLIWEPCTDLNPWLVERFAAQRHCILELKTKTVAVDRLLALDHRRKTIMAWSLNTPRIIATDERRTASLDARLAAAARCVAAGFPVAFHFDPMVIYDGCQEEYRRTIQRLFEKIPADQIVWISLGTFRFMPDLKEMVEARFPRSTIVYGEFVRGLDDKMRYFKPLRISLYRDVVDWIRRYAPAVCLYFCMESEEVWERVFGFSPSAKGGLPAMLDTAAKFHCDLAPEVRWQVQSTEATGC